jgi:hypothetical protein
VQAILSMSLTWLRVKAAPDSRDPRIYQGVLVRGMRQGACDPAGSARSATRTQSISGIDDRIDKFNWAF